MENGYYKHIGSIMSLRALVDSGILDDDSDRARDAFWEGKERQIYNERTLKDKFIPASKQRESNEDTTSRTVTKKSTTGNPTTPKSSMSSSSSSNTIPNIDNNARSKTINGYDRSTVNSNTVTTTSSNNINSKMEKKTTINNKLLPFFDVESIGATGRWISKGGNFLLLPVDSDGNEIKQPTGVIHFLGGALVGAAPHLTYRYLLESLSAAGFIIVATPYRLNLDYLKSCDEILAKFDCVAVELAGEYGPLPVIGIGHSCGALLQTLITSLFPDAPRAINVLISFNNRPVDFAIPAFDELVVPVSEQVMGESDRSKRFRNTLGSLRSAIDNAVDVFADSQLAPAFFGAEIVPLFRQAVEIVDQLPPVLRSIAEGAREFSPTPSDTKEVCRRMYRARRTLLVKFDNDSLDESEDIEKVLKEANTIMRMKRPMVEMEVQLTTMVGQHITPLTQNILLDAPKNVPLIQPIVDFNDGLISPIRTQVRSNFLQTVNQVRDVILEFLDSSFVRVPSSPV